MSFETQCPKCGSKSRFRGNAAGKRAKCSTCSHVYRVPNELRLESNAESPVSGAMRDNALLMETESKDVTQTGRSSQEYRLPPRVLPTTISAFKSIPCGCALFLLSIGCFIAAWYLWSTTVVGCIAAGFIAVLFFSLAGHVYPEFETHSTHNEPPPSRPRESSPRPRESKTHSTCNEPELHEREAVNEPPSESWPGFVYVKVSEDGRVTVNIQNLAEARLALQELRLLKKYLALTKRQIKEQQKAIRAEYTDGVRRRGSKFIGGGGIGRFIRVVQTGLRDNTRYQLAEALAPFDKQVQKIEMIQVEVDRVVIQVEAAVIQYG